MKNTTISCVVLIDDNPADNYFHDIILNEEKFTENIVTCETALEALEVLGCTNKLQPDVIFLDINMPGLSGWQFLERYQSQLCEGIRRPFIFILTTSINSRDEKKAADIGLVDGFLTKPLAPTDLQAIKLRFDSRVGSNTNPFSI